MKKLGNNELELIIGVTALSLPDEILYSNNGQKIFLDLFKITENISFASPYLLQNPELFEQRVFRNILSKKGYLEIYKNEISTFVKNCEEHFLELKSFFINEEVNFPYNFSEITHPIYLTSLDIRNLCKHCKIKYAENNLNLSMVMVENSYYLSTAIYFSSEKKTPNNSKKIREHYEKLGLRPDQMKSILEKSEMDFKLIEKKVPDEFTNFEKKHILLMALKIASIDIENSNSNSFKYLNNYKNQFTSNFLEISSFKFFHYFTDTTFLSQYKNFNNELLTDFLAFFITCLKIDQNVDKSEKKLYVQLLKKLSFELNEDSKIIIAKKTARYQTKEESFLDSFKHLQLHEKVFIFLTSLEILGADRIIQDTEEDFIEPLLRDIEATKTDEICIKSSLLMYLHFMFNNFETTINTHLVSELERFLLKRSSDKINVGILTLIVLYTLDDNISFSKELLSKIKKIYLYNSNSSHQKIFSKEFEKVFIDETKNIKSNPILDFNSEVFLRLVLNTDKCLEFEFFKESLINLTAAHIELSLEHQNISQKFKKLINHFSFELKIKNSTLQVRKKAVEIACELALADEKMSTEELEIINKFTKELYLDERVAFELSTRIMLYSDLKKSLHDYLDYTEYKPS